MDAKKEQPAPALPTPLSGGRARVLTRAGLGEGEAAHSPHGAIVFVLLQTVLSNTPLRAVGRHCRLILEAQVTGAPKGPATINMRWKISPPTSVYHPQVSMRSLNTTP